MRSVDRRRQRVVDGNWSVALPAWGERCVRVLTQSTLPALVVALRAIERPVRLVVWTDQPAAVADAYNQAAPPLHTTLDLRSVPAAGGPYVGLHAGFGTLSTCHASILQSTPAGERVLLLTADMVVSREIIATCDAQIATGKRLVACAAMRATEDAAVPAPIGVSGRDLLSWAWKNRHSMTRESTWPAGRSYDVWRMYFETGDNVAARVFMPHPLAVVSEGRRVPFSPTIDVNLVRHWSQSQTHMITQPEEGAVVELSPPDKEFNLTEPMAARADTGTKIPGAPPFTLHGNPRHRMFFSHRVVIQGTGDVDDAEVVRRMLG